MPIRDTITAFGRAMEGAASAFFDGDGDDLAHEDPMTLEIDDDNPKLVPMPEHRGYFLSFMHHRDPSMHSRPYFFTTQLGAPFPSYHSNPLPDFPARWTNIPGVRAPCENLHAPRIRLAPLELRGKVDERIFEKMQAVAYTEELYEDDDLVQEQVKEHQRERRRQAEFYREKLEQEGMDPTDPDFHCDPRTEEERRAADHNAWRLPILNLSHQCLGDPYQFSALLAFLAVNKSVEHLNLNDNELEDITSLEPWVKNVRELHLSHNNFVTFDAIPAMPNLEKLYVADNFFAGLSGFSKSKFPKLRYLDIDLNPIQHLEDITDRLTSSHKGQLVVVGADPRKPFNEKDHEDDGDAEDDI